jgi:hypothetical protein
MLRDLMTVDHPCIFCEDTITTSLLQRDDETGQEEWTHLPAEEHLCDSLKQVRRERVGTNHTNKSAMRGYGA